MRKPVNISDMIGKTLVSVEVFKRVEEGDMLSFKTADGTVYEMVHEQDCCEVVHIDDICGDMKDLMGSPILQAEESGDGGSGDDGTWTWTFYRIHTAKGPVVIRWYGASNGYYSESVSVFKTVNDKGGPSRSPGAVSTLPGQTIHTFEEI